MVYVALLRGVNVGGKSMVSMAALKGCFEQLGFADVKTYINSGNVIFHAEQGDSQSLATQIETALDQMFNQSIRVLIKAREELRELVTAIPADWINDGDTKCDVLFLWPAIDTPEVLRELPSSPVLEDVRYVPGAVLWHINRSSLGDSRMARIAGTKIYRQMTTRNPNTVRKLLALADEIN